jgi:hypothetical protein
VDVERGLGGAHDQPPHLGAYLAIAVELDQADLVAGRGGVKARAEQGRPGVARRGAAASQRVDGGLRVRLRAAAQLDLGGGRLVSAELGRQVERRDDLLG